MQIKEQVLLLIQHNDDVNSVLGCMLFTAECLFNKFGKIKKKLFYEEYNLLDSGIRKKTRFKIQIKFKPNYLDIIYKYINEKGKYPFPKINHIVKFLKLNGNHENIIYYDDIIYILKKNFTIIYPEENKHFNSLDPKFIMDVFPKIMNKVDKERGITRKNVIESEIYYNNLKLEGKNIVYQSYYLSTKFNKSFRRHF